MQYHVAKIAGLPANLLKRADAILTQLESQGQGNPILSIKGMLSMSKCLSLMKKKKNPYPAELAEVDVYNMTPMQAMNLSVRMEAKL